MRGIRPSVDAPALDYAQLSVDARAGRNPSLKKRARAPVTMVGLAVCATDLRLTGPGDDPPCPGAAASCPWPLCKHGCKVTGARRQAPKRGRGMVASRWSGPVAGAAAKLPCSAHGRRLGPRPSKRAGPGPPEGRSDWTADGRDLGEHQT